MAIAMANAAVLVGISVLGAIAGVFIQRMAGLVFQIEEAVALAAFRVVELYRVAPGSGGRVCGRADTGLSVLGVEVDHETDVKHTLGIDDLVELSMAEVPDFAEPYGFGVGHSVVSFSRLAGGMDLLMAGLECLFNPVLYVSCDDVVSLVAV